MSFLSLMTLTFKLIRARDQTHLCEFGANPFSGSQDISFVRSFRAEAQLTLESSA